MFPPLDLPGFLARTVMPSADVARVEKAQPGFTVQQIASAWSFIGSRLRKRYKPFGELPPVLVPAGTFPPDVILSGRPVLGSMQVQIAIIAGGALGTATFAWSADNGATWFPQTSEGATTLAAIRAGAVVAISTAVPPYTLGTTGLQATFPVGNYSADNVYASATPVPETVLSWIVYLITPNLYAKRGYNPADPQIEGISGARDRALEEIKEAADSKDGLFDLPISEDLGSAITAGGPRFYSETSPYVWMDQQACIGRQQDSRGRGGR